MNKRVSVIISIALIVAMDCLAATGTNPAATSSHGRLSSRDSNYQEGNENFFGKNRRYRYPSIMVEADMRGVDENGMERIDILTGLVVKRWRILGDRYGRGCQYISPEISYNDLWNILNFKDSDVQNIPTTMTYVEIQNTLGFHDDVLVDKHNNKPGPPQAFIKTPWLTCTITYLDKQYDGSDTSVRLVAVVIDNKVQAAAEAHAAADKKKSILQTIIDFFRTSPH